MNVLESADFDKIGTGSVVTNIRAILLHQTQLKNTVIHPDRLDLDFTLYLFHKRDFLSESEGAYKPQVVVIVLIQEEAALVVVRIRMNLQICPDKVHFQGRYLMIGKRA